MAVQERHAHILHLPGFFTIIRYIQLVLAVLILGLSAFEVYLLPFNAHGYAIFVSLYTIGIIIYFLFASTATPKSYNWIALLVLEVLALIFWLAAWAVLAALFAILAYVGSSYNYSYTSYLAKRKLEPRDAYSYGVGYAGSLLAAIALAVIQFLIYICTLVYMCRAIHRHRKSGQPVRADKSAHGAPTSNDQYPSTTATPSDHEKGPSVPMQPMNSNQEYYAQPAPPYPQTQQKEVHMPAEPETEPSRVHSPASSPYPSEMGIGNHGEMHEAPNQRF